MTNDFTNQRQSERTDTGLKAMLKVNEDILKCGLCDISMGGAKLIVDQRFERLSVCTLDLGAIGHINGEVMWSREGYTGLKFSGNETSISDIITIIAMNA